MRQIVKAEFRGPKRPLGSECFLNNPIKAKIHNLVDLAEGIKVRTSGAMCSGEIREKTIGGQFLFVESWHQPAGNSRTTL